MMSYPPRPPMNMQTMLVPPYGYPPMGMVPMGMMPVHGMMRPGMQGLIQSQIPRQFTGYMSDLRPPHFMLSAPQPTQPQIITVTTPVAAAVVKEKPPVTTVFVGNIHEKAPDNMIKQMLQKCGNVLSWKRVQGASGKLQAFGFCEYEDPESTLRCMRLLNDWAIGDKKLVVKVDAKTKSLLDEHNKKQEDKEAYKEKEEGESTSDTETSGNTEEKRAKQDGEVKVGLDLIMREYSAEINKQPILPYSGTDDTERKAAQIKAKKSREEYTAAALNIMQIEDDKKDLISREIRSFRDSHLNIEEPRDKDRSSKDREREKEREAQRRREDERDRERRRERDREREREREKEREREHEREREKERERERETSKQVEIAKSRSKTRDRSPNHERNRDVDHDMEDEDEMYERKKLSRRLREKEAAYQELLNKWEMRERKKMREYEKERLREREKKAEETKECKRLREFLEDYDDDRDDAKYYKGSALQRRLNERAKEMEGDERDRQRERDELEEIRKKLLQQGHPDPNTEMARIEREREEHLLPMMPTSPTGSESPPVIIIEENGGYISPDENNYNFNEARNDDEDDNMNNNLDNRNNHKSKKNNKNNNNTTMDESDGAVDDAFSNNKNKNKKNKNNNNLNSLGGGEGVEDSSSCRLGFINNNNSSNSNSPSDQQIFNNKNKNIINNNNNNKFVNNFNTYNDDSSSNNNNNNINNNQSNVAVRSTDKNTSGFVAVPHFLNEQSSFNMVSNKGSASVLNTSSYNQNNQSKAINNNNLSISDDTKDSISSPGLQKRRKPTVSDVFNNDDEDESQMMVKKRKLVPLDYDTNLRDAGAEEETTVLLSNRKNDSSVPSRVVTGSNQQVGTGANKNNNNNNSSSSSFSNVACANKNNNNKSGSGKNNNNSSILGVVGSGGSNNNSSLGGQNAAVSAEEKRKCIKNLIDSIPTAKEQLFEFKIDWNMVDATLMDRRIKPWVNKKIIEYIGEDEPTLCEFICKKVIANSTPSSILADISMVLDEEAEVFVVKMWRLLIYETEAKKRGLVK